VIIVERHLQTIRFR